MIIVKLMGGLGNQMFQAATSYALAKYHNAKLKLDLSFLLRNNKSTETFTARNYELNAFDYNFEIATEKDIDFFFPKNKLLARRIIRKAKRLIYKPQILKEIGFIENIFERTSKNTYLDGYWQSEEYFKNFKNDILKIFKFPEIENKFENIKNEILNYNSVSLHFRRGDYANNQHISSVFRVCDLKYYKEALKIISKKIDNPKLFLFSDEPEWIEKNFESEYNYKIVSTNSVINDLQLMSFCKHNIIANSSYSWWGAWLNSNNEKIVIAPEKWYIKEEDNQIIKYLIPKLWKQI